jgi:son of sevenless-like protein
LSKLIERLADHNPADAEYRNAFLLTHHSFTTSLDLLDLLMKRYDISPPYGLDHRMFEIYVNRKIVPVRLRVFNVRKTWMSKYTEDFTKNRQLTERCMWFVQTEMSQDFGEITVQLMQTLTRYLEGLPGES